MRIECPQCHSIQPVDPAALPGEGLEIACSQCGLMFTVRSHPSQEGDSEREFVFSAMPTDGQIDTEIPSESPHEQQGPFGGLPLEAFLQKDEIPFRIVQAYENYERERTLHHGDEAGATPSTKPGTRMIDDYSISIRDGEPSSRDLGEEGWPGSSVPLEPRSFREKRRQIARLRIPLFVLLALTALAIAAVFLRRFLPENPLQGMKQLAGKVVSQMPFQQGDRGSIQFSDLNSYFISVGKGQTPAFVIEGKVTNHYPTPCQFVQVKGILFDARGDRAAEEVVYCGNVLKKQGIQVSTPERIHEVLQTASGSALANINIEPGKSIPFMLVFFNPPENVSEFSVEIFQYQKKKEPEAGGSAPGSPESPPGTESP